MPKPRIGIPAWLKTHNSFLLIAGGILIPVLVINPFRQMLSEDDSWAYARMVQHLLATGKYRLDSWAAADMPVQIYLAAAASKAFGYSLPILRCTTLVFFVIAALSFYLLLREVGRERSSAAVTTSALIASPLVLMLAFTFMSDVQFLGWLMLSMWLYVRGITRANLWLIFFGALAAGCAIGTRQFGIAIVGGFAAASLFPRRENRCPVRVVVAGLAAPLAFAAAQVYVSLHRPTFTQTYRIQEVQTFLRNPAVNLLGESVWRVVVIAQYSGMCLMPLLFLLLPARRGQWKSKFTVILATSAAVLAALMVGSRLTARPEAQQYGHREPLQLYWLLPTQLHAVPWSMWILDAGGIIGAGCAVWMLTTATRRNRTAATYLLAGTGTSLLVLHICYVQLNDTYMVGLLPFMLLPASGVVEQNVSETRYKLSVCASLLAITGCSLWMRAEYSAQEAAWKSADAAFADGIAPADIDAPLHWAEYHGAFDDWIAAGAPGFRADESSDRGRDALHDPFYAWVKARSSRAHCRFVDSQTGYDSSVWRPIRTFSYRDAKFAEHHLVTLRRQ